MLKEFWKEFDSIGISIDINNTALPDYTQKENGTLTTNTEESLRIWTAHFNTLLNVDSVDSEPCCIKHSTRVLSRNEFLREKMVRGKYALGRGLGPFPPGKC